MDTLIYVSQIIQGAKTYRIRTGQYLFNHLPQEVQHAICGTYFDPFNKDLTDSEIKEFLDQHLIFDGHEIVGCFSGNKILWKKQ